MIPSLRNGYFTHLTVCKVLIWNFWLNIRKFFFDPQNLMFIVSMFAGPFSRFIYKKSKVFPHYVYYHYLIVRQVSICPLWVKSNTKCDQLSFSSLIWLLLLFNCSSGVDLALMSLANHSIMTYGTFGIWGALLSGGNNLMPASHNMNEVTKDVLLANLTGWEVI